MRLRLDKIEGLSKKMGMDSPDSRLSGMLCHASECRRSGFCPGLPIWRVLAVRPLVLAAQLWLYAGRIG
jgi:hypothetical protein